jgi:hypothetical protein
MVGRGSMGTLDFRLDGDNKNNAKSRNSAF